MTRPVYLDYASTTPIHPRALEAMEPWLRSDFGNPSSLYPLGRRARQAVNDAREQVATVTGAHPDEVIFTGGGSESDSLALKGVLLSLPQERRHLITTTIEHSAVLESARQLEAHFGVRVTWIPVDASGIVDPSAVLEATTPETGLISVMLANNEIGTIQPVAAIAQAARERGILMHTDAVQAAGVVSLDIRELGVDLMSLTAHKVYGPKGVGVLVARRGVDLLPLVSGGDQESGRRAGTENVAGIVGCGAAFELVEAHREATVVRLSTLRNRLMAGIEQRVPEAILNGDRQQRLPGNANYCFPGTQGETILLELEARNVYVASGSACHAGSTDPSHVLLAIGRSPELAHTAVRFSLGAPTTEADINAALDALVAAVAAVRGRV